VSAEAVQRWAAFCGFKAADAGDVLLGVESNREKMEGNGTMMGLLRRVAGALGVAALCWTTGCAGFWVAAGSSSSNSSSSTSGDIVYVANGTADTVSGFVVGTGTLTAVSPVSPGFSPTALAVNPANSILFVAGNSQIAAYSTGTGGVLGSLSSGVTGGLLDVVAMDISPDGQWLFAVDGTLSSNNIVTVYEFQINSSTGVLTQEATGTFTLPGTMPTPPPTPSAIKVSPVASNGQQYVFVALGTGGDLAILLTTSNGALSSPTQMTLASLPQYTSDNALAVNADSSILYIARSNTSSSPGAIVAYSIEPNGVLNPVPVAQGATGVMPSAVVLNAAGKGVYVANRTDGNISEFSTTTSGGLTLLGTIGSGSLPIGLAVDNSGDYLLAAANGGSSDLTMYSYDSTTTGKLDSSAATATGTGPVAIAATH
jgi:6-phosphogluconolactonase